MKYEKSSGLPLCPKCNYLMREVLDNVGFTEPEGPAHYEVVCFQCPNCGHKEE